MTIAPDAPTSKRVADADAGLADDIRALVAAIHRAQSVCVTEVAAMRPDPNVPDEARAMFRQMRAGARWSLRMNPTGEIAQALERLAKMHPTPRNNTAFAQALLDYAAVAEAWSLPAEAAATRYRASDIARSLRHREAGRPPTTPRSRAARDWLDRLTSLLAERMKRAKAVLRAGGLE